MIRITQLKLPITHTREDLEKKAAKLLRVGPGEVKSLRIVKQSVDARKKSGILYSYTVDVEVLKESRIVKRANSSQIGIVRQDKYRFPVPGGEPLLHPPVIVGSGPAGLFCGLMLAEAGYMPVLLERGEDVDGRKKKVERFWQEGILDPQTNVQFGEGGDRKSVV